MRITGRLRRLHDVDDALVRRLGVGIDDDERLAHIARRAAQRGADRIDIVGGQRRLVDHDLTARRHGDMHLIGLLALLFGIRCRQIDLQAGELGIRRRQHQENDDDQQHVDHRNQVDFRLILAITASKIHARASALAFAMQDFDQAHGLLLHLNDVAIDLPAEMPPENHARDGDHQTEVAALL